jgi:PAS domain S-box-containing protein
VESLPEQALAELVELAARISDASLALLALTHEDRVWFKSSAEDIAPEALRDLPFHAAALAQHDLLLVSDAAQDERFAHHPLVAGEPGIRFYAGVPLCAADGRVLGTLSVMDRATRSLTAAQQDLLRALGRQAVVQLVLRHAARELTRNEALLFTVFRACPAALTLHRSSDRTFVEVNAAFTQLTGWPREEVIGRTASELGLVDADTAARLQAQLADQGLLRDVEISLTTRGGETRQVLLGTECVELHGDKHVLTTLVDITERKQAEAALRESELRNRIIANLVSDYAYIFRVTPDGRLVGEWVTESFTRVFGMTLPEIQALGGWQELVVPEDLRLALAHAQKVAAGKTDVCEMRWRTATGEIRWLRDYAQPVFDESGTRVVRVFGASQDITERKRAEEARRESEHLLSESQRIAHIGSWWLDLQGRHRWSDETYRLFGLSPEAGIITTETFLTLIHPDDRPAMQAWITACAAGQRPDELQFRIVRPDGTERWMSGRGELVRDATGRPVHMAGTVQDITERRQAEAALRESEERFRLLVDHAPEAIVQLDVETGRFVHSNPAAERLFGLSAAELARLGPVELSPPVQPDGQPSETKARALIAAALAGETPVFEWMHRDPTGRDIPCEVRLLRMDFGGRTILRGSVLDITERKAAEARIHRLNRTYAVLSDINQLIVREADPQALLAGACRIAVEKGGFQMAWIDRTDADGQLQVAAHTGATPDALDVLRPLVEGPQPDCALTFQAFRAGQRAVCNDIATDERTRAWREAALARNFRAMASLPLKVRGRVVGTFNLYAGELGFFDEEELRLLDELAVDIGFALEVHERELARQHAEAALRESEERFREIAETIQEVFWVTDAAKTRMLYVSPAYERIWGRPCQSLYESPRDWLEAIHPDDREHVAHAAATQQASGRYNVEYRIVRPDGQVRWIRDVAFPVRDGSGQVVRVVGVARDVTERRELAEQLRQAQKMEAIGQLAGGVAHDFNNILAVIMMQVGLTESLQNLPHEAREGLEQIRLAAGRAANLTRQLLLFSRRQVMQPRILDLNEVVTSLAKMLQRIIGEDVRLELRLHPAPLMTRADAGMLDQVLMNLAVNARDAMPRGGKLVVETAARTLTEAETAAIPEATAGRYVSLRVTDAGSGIPPEILPRIFEPFFTTKEPGKGTGLGLATVYGIVNQHGGCIRVTSEPGRGTSFEVLLPAREDASAEAGEAAQPVPRGGTETILLVEDDAAVRQLTRAVLEAHGYRVLEAAHGREALALWEQADGRVDLLLADLVMPEGLSGSALAERLRARRSDLRVVFTSGYSAEIAGRELSLKPGQNFLQKPATSTDLLDTVRRCLDG